MHVVLVVISVSMERIVIGNEQWFCNERLARLRRPLKSVRKGKIIRFCYCFRFKSWWARFTRSRWGISYNSPPADRLQQMSVRLSLSDVFHGRLASSVRATDTLGLLFCQHCPFFFCNRVRTRRLALLQFHLAQRRRARCLCYPSHHRRSARDTLSAIYFHVYLHLYLN